MFRKVSIGPLGRTAGSLVSDNAQTRFCPGVLYADRGVIALNKPPGLVSQGATVHSHSKENPLDAVPSNFAFNAVLDGTFFVSCSIVG
jgi:hypothetical protein